MKRSDSILVLILVLALFSPLAVLIARGQGSGMKGSDMKGSMMKTVKLEKVWELPGFMNPESVIHDPARNVFYVTNVNGNPTDKDGNGFISRVSIDGKMLDQKWIEGLNGPKGTAIVGDKLYVADIDRLAEVDIVAGKLIRFYEAPKAKFLNDVTADMDGNVYVSDMYDDAIYRLKDGTFEIWIRDPGVSSPNGLLAEKDRLVVAEWGIKKDGEKELGPGHLITVRYKDKKLGQIGDGTPIGGLDGLEHDGRGGYYVTDWGAGKMFDVPPSGHPQLLLTISQGTADLEHAESLGLVIIPLMKDNKIVAYKEM